MECEKFKAKFDRIFQHVGAETASIWKGEKWSDYVDALNYVTCIQGQKISVKLAFTRGDRIKANVSVGHYQEDYRHYFSKEISFSAGKSENQIVQDLLKRLELNSLNDRVLLLLEGRKERMQKEDDKKNRIELFKRLLPFRESYSGKLSAYFANNTRIEFDPIYNVLEIRGDCELIMAACGKLSELLKK